MPADDLPPLRLHSMAEFRWRVLGFAAFGLGFVLVSLGLGVLGYRSFAGLGWVESLLNASMILTGMGPVDPMTDDRAKVFASLYALYSGAVYPAVTAIVLYPFLHRMMHLLHLQVLADGGEEGN